MKIRRLGRHAVSLALLGLAVALVAACSLVPSAVSRAGTDRISATVTKEFTVGAAPELVVSDQVGAVSVQAGDAGKISVEAVKRARTQAALDRIEVGMTQEGSVVRLDFKVPQGTGSTDDPAVEFKVKVPAGTKTSLTTETGAIEVSGLTNGVSAKTTTGAITTKNVKGLHALAVTTGAITVTGAEGTVQATTVTGGIDLDGILSGENWARATTGGVTVKLPTSASLKVTAKGTSAESDFGLAAQGSQLSGNVGAGTGGSLDASAGTGLVQIRKK